MVVASRTLPDAYQDSVKLMRAASDVSETYDVEEALAVMATDENKAMVTDAGLLDADEVGALDPNDLLLVVDADDEATASAALEALASGIHGSQSTGRDDGERAPPPQSLYSAIGQLPNANLALVSVPGEYAAREAWKALHEGLHVHVFSDNVDLEDERALKTFGREHDRLVMGPDCGTAIINGVPLGFANAVDRGTIGVVAASGTGLQEVTALVDRAGGGVSQAIGTGGRDLSGAVGGLTMQQGLDRLAADPETEVVVLVSKPPEPETLDPLLEAVEVCDKPVVVDFIGADEGGIAAAGATPADSLADAARLALEASGQRGGSIRFEDGVSGFADPTDAGSIAAEVGDPAPSRTALRGLYTGGTFAVEAVTVLERYLTDIGTNLGAGSALRDPLAPAGHAVVDLGADAFTRGRPHPMIDPSLRTEQLESALDSDDVLVVLVDVVLGYGAHADPAGPVVEAVTDAATDGWPAVVASVCGTRDDPQDWPGQVTRLVDAGVHVTETNAAAARLAGELWAASTGPRGGD